MKLRLLSSLVLIPLVLWLTYVGGWPFVLLWLAIGALVFYEWVNFTNPKHSMPMAAVWALWHGGLLFGASFLGGSIAFLLYGLSFLVLAIYIKAASQSWGLLLGNFYASILLFVPIFIRSDPTLSYLALFVFYACVWGTDTLAYFVGKAIGGPKLAPRISPNKTWSGFVGGLVGGTAAAVAVHIGFGEILDLLTVIIYMFLSLLCHLGDLFQSFFKRKYGVKDSGAIIPGHGGVMDRVDGLVFVLFGVFLLVFDVWGTAVLLVQGLSEAL